MAMPIEAADHSEADSAYVTSEISTTSVTSSIYAYEKEFGRSYHAYNAGKYHLPNDEGEQERMDIHYHSLRLIMNNKLFLCPLENPSSLLDVGTGTGIWAMDAADEFPGADVVGFDLSPIQPSYVPPNCSFQVFDLENEWDMPGRFDLVHTRFMNGFCVKNWPKFFEEAFQSLRPGGWVENQELDFDFATDDDSVPDDSGMQRWQRSWNSAMEKVGMTGNCDSERIAKDMRDAGFINVTIVSLKMPVGPWPKDKRLREAGLFNFIGLYDGLYGLSAKPFLHLLGWPQSEFETLMVETRQDLKNKNFHSYFPIYIIYGQKPLRTDSIE